MVSLDWTELTERMVLMELLDRRENQEWESKDLPGKTDEMVPMGRRESRVAMELTDSQEIKVLKDPRDLQVLRVPMGLQVPLDPRERMELQVHRDLKENVVLPVLMELKEMKELRDRREKKVLLGLLVLTESLWILLFHPRIPHGTFGRKS